MIRAQELTLDLRTTPVQVAAASDGSAVASVDLSDPTKFPFSSTGKWKGYLEFLGKPGTERSLGQPDLLLPLLQDKNDMTFFNLRGQLQFDNTDVHEYNIGLGHRHMFQEWILGGYGYYDKRHTQLGNSYNQFTGGLELMSVDWAFRANGYLPENKTETITSGANVTVIRPGDQIKVQIGGIVQEKALPGVDGEVGYLLPIPWEETYELRVYAGGYHFFGEDNFESVTGPRGRVEWRAYDLPIIGPGSRFMMGVEAQWDEPRGSQAFGLASLRIPFDVFADKSKRKGLKGLDRRMLQPVIRDVDVVTSEKNVPAEIVPALHPAGHAYTKVVEIDLTDPKTDTAEEVQAEVDRIKAELPNDKILFEFHGDSATVEDRGDGDQRHYLDLNGNQFTATSDDTYASAGKNLNVGYLSQRLGPGIVGYTPNGTPVGFMNSGCSNSDSLFGIEAGGHLNGLALDAAGCGYGALIQGNDTGTRYMTNMHVMNAGRSGVRVEDSGNVLIIADSTFTGNSTLEDLDNSESPDGAVEARSGGRIEADNLTIGDNLLSGVTSRGVGSYITLTKSTVSGNFYGGLNADEGGEIYAKNLLVEWNKNWGVRVQNYLYGPIGSKVTIIDSTVAHTQPGEAAFGTGLNAVFGNDFGTTTLIARNVKVHNNMEYGVTAWGNTHVDISHSQIYENDLDGIHAYDGGSVVANYVTITDNDQEGVEVQANSTLTITNSTISGNGSHGLYANKKLLFSSAPRISGIIEATNVIVEDNGGYGVVSADGDITINNSVVSGNARGNYKNITSGALLDLEATVDCITVTPPGGSLNKDGQMVDGSPGPLNSCPP